MVSADPYIVDTEGDLSWSWVLALVACILTIPACVMVLLSADPYIVGKADVTDEPQKEEEEEDEDAKKPYTISVED